MRIAFLILAHKNPDQLKRLVSVLLNVNSKVFIHIDSKSDVNAFHKAMQELNNQNIVFVKSRNTKWSTISVTEARIDLLKESISISDWVPDYIVMLSGQTYPIKPLTELFAFLEKNEGVSFIEHFSLPCKILGENSGMDRINCYSYSIGNRLITYFPRGFKTTFNIRGKIINIIMSVFHVFKPKRKFPSYIKPFYGIDWWVITKDAVEYILDFINAHPDYHKYNRHTKQTCEIYFPSILAGADFKGKLVNNSLHFMLWESQGSGHTANLTENNFNQIIKSDAFFARKFDICENKDVLDRIDAEILSIK